MATPPPVDRRTDHVHHRSGSAGRTIAIIVLVVVLLALIAWATGLLDFRAEGALETPKVEVSGGELPSVDVKTADVDVGTKEVTVEVPTVNVEKASEK